jgi:hypothetical protein
LIYRKIKNDDDDDDNEFTIILGKATASIFYSEDEDSSLSKILVNFF